MTEHPDQGSSSGETTESLSQNDDRRAPDRNDLFHRKIGEKLTFDRAFVRLFESTLRKKRDGCRAPNFGGRKKLFEHLVATKKEMVLHLEHELGKEYDPSKILTPSPELTVIAQLGIVSIFVDTGAPLRKVLQALKVIEISSRMLMQNLSKYAESIGEIDFSSRLREIQKNLDENLETLLNGSYEPSSKAGKEIPVKPDPPQFHPLS